MTEAKLRCVFVHGWGMNHAVWQPVVQALPDWIEPLCIDLPGHGLAAQHSFASLDDLVSALRDQVTEPALWVGWSLGGLAVTQLALRFPEQVRGLLLVANSPSFVARPGWSCGMPEAVFDGFAAELEQDYATTIRRFLSLQVKDSASGRQILKTLRQKILQLPAARMDALRAGLLLLKTTDLRSRLADLNMPVAWLLGGRDGLVNASLAQQLDRLMPRASVTVIEQAAHAPFLSHGDAFNQQLMAMAEKIV
ncbi:MAG TPA: pimeloyl-ACP methyl ester esterase BioH [Pseudomonadales bacterium]